MTKHIKTAEHGREMVGCGNIEKDINLEKKNNHKYNNDLCSKIYHFLYIYIYIHYIMLNRWVEHVKNYAKPNNISYDCAIIEPNCKNN
jgi:hypothetical protein